MRSFIDLNIVSLFALLFRIFSVKYQSHLNENPVHAIHYTGLPDERDASHHWPDGIPVKDNLPFDLKAVATAIPLLSLLRSDLAEGILFQFCASVHHCIGQMKHQLDATLCRFYFCRVTLYVSGASAHHQEYLKLVQRPLVLVLSLQVSHHISLLGPEANEIPT